MSNGNDNELIAAMLGVGGLYASRAVAPGYLGRGAHFMGGYMPESYSAFSGKTTEAAAKHAARSYTPGINVQAAGSPAAGTMTFGTARFEQPLGRSGFGLPKHLSIDRAQGEIMGKTLGRGWSALGSSIGPVMSAYFIYDGYRENGLQGAFDAGVWDLAVSSSISHNMFSSVTMSGAAAKADATLWGSMTAGEQTMAGQKGARVTVNKARFGMGGMLRVGLGAGIGAGIGQEYLGTPGAFIGGFAGGGLMRNWKVGLVGALAIGGASIVSKGAYSLLKSGYRHHQKRKRIDTAGDTAAFFTNNAMTMRSRSVQSMRNSHMNARSALGMEANFMHTNKNYFSAYRYNGQ